MADADQLKLVTREGHPPNVVVGGGTPAQATVATLLATQFGCRTRHIESPEALLATLERLAGIDLVLLDQAHSHGAVPVAAPAIRHLAQTLGVPLIRLAGHPGRDPDRPDRMVHKPYSPRDLYAAMRDALRPAA